MTKLEKIENEIRTLSAEDVRKLSAWLTDFQDDLWDEQIKADAEAGRLDKFLAEARKDIADGKLSPI